MPFRVLKFACFFATVNLFVPRASFAQTATGIHFGDLAGTWTLASIYRTVNVQGPSASEANRLLRTHVVYGAHRMSSCGTDVTITGAEEHELSQQDLIQDARVHFSELGLKGKTVEGITVGQGPSGTCFGSFPLPGRVLYIKSKNELVIDFEGVFYRAVRSHW